MARLRCNISQWALKIDSSFASHMLVGRNICLKKGLALYVLNYNLLVWWYLSVFGTLSLLWVLNQIQLHWCQIKLPVIAYPIKSFSILTGNGHMWVGAIAMWDLPKVILLFANVFPYVFLKRTSLSPIYILPPLLLWQMCL